VPGPFSTYGWSLLRLKGPVPIEPDDGQLHTLGILERLPAAARTTEGAYSDLYDHVDRLLLELANPNLHDIANMAYRVELWDRHAKHIRWTLAAIGHVTIA
jgi:hypothetical protein